MLYVAEQKYSAHSKERWSVAKSLPSFRGSRPSKYLKLEVGDAFTKRRQNFKSKRIREDNLRLRLGKKKRFCPWTPFSVSHVDVRNCRATRKTVLIYICNPSIFCMSLIGIRPLDLMHTMNRSKNNKIRLLCFVVMDTILSPKSIWKPRWRVTERGSSLLLSFNSIPS